MRPVDPTVWWALATVFTALVGGFFGLRAAGRTAQPSAQDAINAGFTALTQRQVEELLQLRTDVNGLKATNKDQGEKIDRLEEHVDRQDVQIRDMARQETRYQHALQILLDHVANLRTVIANAGLGVPPDPIDFASITALLSPEKRRP